MLGHFVFGDRTEVSDSDDARGGEAAGAVIIELPMTREALARIQAGEWPDDHDPAEHAPAARQSHLTVVS